MKNVEENRFVSPLIKTVKNKESFGIVLALRKINDSCIIMKPHMPNLSELMNQKTTGITGVQNEPLWTSKINFEYAYIQLVYLKRVVDTAALKKREKT